MRKITFTNEVNGLSVMLASDTPTALLETFDGCSCGAEAITYRPLNYNGQRFVSSTLTARTIPFTASFGGIRNDRYSREEAIRRFEDVQRVFVPGQIGTLTWTDGINTRFIKCRAESVPMPTEVLPFLLRADFSLVADNPLWFDIEEHSAVGGGGAGNVNLTINNTCGLAVPFIMEVEGNDSGLAVIAEFASDNKWLSHDRGLSYNYDPTKYPGSFTVDTGAATVTYEDGTLCNQLLTASSTFFPLEPGENKLRIVGHKAKFIWHDAYLSVY